ncbi:winged helix-turn-helix domain-containing protein [Aminobacter sp. SR38]|jgi:DNA-binding winged helix-turn-helix (wHTH) protein/tetratricopeptide (TPR) repeat protein|uniref:winged helix-turn-helix domain-containing tetratricopeptide repeat protein n=1 Tax=Aminobacter sp. SR38 TaxID=2774562 RepID=UPI00177DE224|nr:winged helix-turn-helix domain-containing protein [Aminobacter sp. SR38]QOF69479.1 winged helix-turn-helix domain-containing protein [Aminobacter sp. SR38]
MTVGNLTPIQFRGFTLDLNRGLLLKDGSDIPLRRKAFELLACLAKQAGRVVPKADLIDTVWPDVIVTEDSLTQAIREIRKALGEVGPAAIRTVAGRGYFLDPGTRDVFAAAPDSGETPIATLLFDDRTPGSDGTYAAMLCEEIITGLARFRTVPVIARATSLASANADKSDPKELGRRLGARYLVDGHIERTAGMVRVGVSLIDATDGSLLWADRIEVFDPDPLALEDLIARQVISRLVSHVEDASLRLAARKPPADRKAHDLLLQGIALLRGYGEGDNQKAHDVLSDALARDPTNGLIHSYLALATTILGNYGLSTNTELLVALNLASTGVSLAPEEARTHRILGLVRLYLREYDAAEHHVARSLELNPYDADTIAQMGYLLVLRGRVQEGIGWMDRAVRLNPLHPDWYHFDRSMALYLAGDYAGAVTRLRKIPRLGSWGLARLGAAQAMARDIVGAKETAVRRKSLQQSFDPIDYATRGIAFERPEDREAILAGVRAFLQIYC